ncbi:unnamed protein product [Sphenostylis stenocarpa]|uniref:Sacsin/Nov domain-containing protein n=1 Tax=Sphenostylis stenocarpa TaxID=92480 RepID=A0AA86VJ58_9FABA|nr:unnamed protein product [Sphenostylis stenocarpa]
MPWKFLPSNVNDNSKTIDALFWMAIFIVMQRNLEEGRVKKMRTPKEHIEEIRSNKFSIGKDPNPLIEDLHQAVKNLSVEIYTKDVHFLMELIQNAEDNVYSNGRKPSLEFIITSKDITATGAPATLLIFNNEDGFSPKNIESVCSVGRSTKKGKRNSGYVGEKGIGFKSVFLVTTQPYIFSNGYQICFNEKPCPQCGLGYIVPEWVEEKPILQDIQKIYNAAAESLPSTILVLPLKPDKISAVKQQLSNFHPEILLFLSKIRNISVREHNEGSKKSTVSAISISTEIELVTRKNMNAESYTLCLSAQENGGAEKECSYYMWKQKFPVRKENVVERRIDVEEWVVTLAFPHQDRLNRGMSSPGVYAFLPTEMVTNFPFIIQADFILASSRETILMDDKWNHGILDCVPSAFVNSFKTLVLGSDQAPVSSLTHMFKFIPVNNSPYEKLNYVREKIKSTLLEENIIPIETYKDQKCFCKPPKVGRLLPDFRNILTDARTEGIRYDNLSAQDGRKIMSSSLDISQYNGLLNYLGVQQIKSDWYAKCIQSSNLVGRVSEGLYLKLLLFVAKNWESFVPCSDMPNFPLLKYVSSDGSLSRCSVNDCINGSIRLVRANPRDSCPCSWLINWNRAFSCHPNRYFMPEITQNSILSFPQKNTLLEWLEIEVGLTTFNVYTLAKDLSGSIKNNSKLVIIYANFLFHSFSNGFISKSEVDALCSSMPLVDNNGIVNKSRKGILLPASVSNWANFIHPNPWRNENYVELGEEYLNRYNFAGQFTDNKMLINFLTDHLGDFDIPDMYPPNAGFSAADRRLTKENAFLLLEWVRKLNKMSCGIPERFLISIKKGSWLKVTVNEYMPPSKSFLIGSSLGTILQSCSDLVDIPLVDEAFYGSRIHEYEKELKTVGVMFSSEEAFQFIGEELMRRAKCYNLSSKHVILILKFIQCQRQSFLPLDKFVNSVRNGSWLKTSRGLRSPVGSVLYDKEWEIASKVSDIPFIDKTEFGEEIYNFKEELKLLGVIIVLSGNYQVVTDNLKLPFDFGNLKAETILLLLECIRFSSASNELTNSIKSKSCLKTNIGFKTPGECFLYDPVWGCILEVFSGIPVIDKEIYGEKIFNYKSELKQIGVVVDFEEAIKKFGDHFKLNASQSSFSEQHAKSFLSCVRLLKGTQYNFPSDFLTTVRNVKWLLTTRLGGYRCPTRCILDSVEWKSISSISCLPFIDDSDNCYGKGIHEYKEELKIFGVITELKDGVKFVLKCLNFPSDPSTIAPESVFSLLECIRLQMKRTMLPIDDDLRKRLSRNWLKTHDGYTCPDKCLLFDSKWDLYFKPTDGLFIDENFYGSKISSYKKELIEIGVTADLENGCDLAAKHLYTLSADNSIVQIYRYLSDQHWKPGDKAARKIWIPKRREWVHPEECVIHDHDKLFGSKFYVLEDFYDKKILPFFSFAMEVRNKPSVDDYINLWNEWESSEDQLSYDNCSKFWTSCVERFTSNTGNKLCDTLLKLPASSGNDEIVLLEKEDIFIPDNLHLKKLFEMEKVFVWYPQNLAPSSRSKLSDLYRKIGARNISECICTEDPSLLNVVQLKKIDAGNVCNLKVLVKLILGFLACSSLKIEPKKRHEAVQGLLNLSFFETTDSIDVSYSLALSTGNILTKRDNRMVRWESKSSKFFTQMNWKAEIGSFIKYATYFSEVISEGVLCERHDHVGELSELIRLAFVLKFNDEAVEFLMESKNLQIFSEDDEFLCSAVASTCT